MGVYMGKHYLTICSVYSNDMTAQGVLKPDKTRLIGAT